MAVSYTHLVLPSIRKHGAYMTDSLLDALEAHPEAVPEYLNRLRSENARNRELNRRLRLALPKAEYYDAFVDPADCTNIRTTAKELGVPEKQFTRYLEEKKYLFRDKNRKLFPRAVKKDVYKRQRREAARCTCRRPSPPVRLSWQGLCPASDSSGCGTPPVHGSHRY